jgi:hypothetical protein
MSRGEFLVLSRKELGLLGKVPDRELARQFGRTLQAIIGKRHILAIPRHIGADEDRPWTAAEDKLLGTKLDSVLAKELGRRVVTVRKRRKRKEIPHFRYRPWTPAEEALLGQRKDNQLALEVGRALSAVKRRRQQLGIPPFRT